jgi:hypothetical protein
MRTGLVRCYGEKDTVQEYIDVAVRHFRRSKVVHDTALKMFNYMAQNTTFSGLSPSMRAMTLVNLAAIDRNEIIPSKAWSGNSSCSYNTLTEHSKKFKMLLEDHFPNLKYHRIGR